MVSTALLPYQSPTQLLVDCQEEDAAYMEVAATLQSVCIGSATALGERPDQQVSSGHHMRESVLGGLPRGCSPSGVVSLALSGPGFIWASCRVT